METLIIQIGIRHSRVAEVFRSDGQSVCIGRNFKNDIVLTDPYVAPDQICITRVDEKWMIQVLDQTNPVYINGVPVDEDIIEVISGDRLTLGRTTLSIFSENHKMEPTRKLLLASWLHRDTIGLLYPILAVLFVACMEGFLDYVQFSSSKDDWKEYLGLGIIATFVLFAWASLWAIAGRIFRHQHHFPAQLLATALIYGVLVLALILVGYVEYATSSLFVAQFLGYSISFLAFAWLLRINLLFATNVKRAVAVSVAVSGICIFFVIAMTNIYKADFNANPYHSESLKPPFAHITGDESIDDYFAAFEKKLTKFER